MNSLIGDCVEQPKAICMKGFLNKTMLHEKAIYRYDEKGYDDEMKLLHVTRAVNFIS